jgi:hypothetical protein
MIYSTEFLLYLTTFRAYAFILTICLFYKSSLNFLNDITNSLMHVIVLFYMMTWSNTLGYSYDFFCVFFPKCFSLCFVLSDTY